MFIDKKEPMIIFTLERREEKTFFGKNSYFDYGWGWSIDLIQEMNQRESNKSLFYIILNWYHNKEKHFINYEHK